jgi:hypothetical protein
LVGTNALQYNCYSHRLNLKTIYGLASPALHVTCINVRTQ